MSIARWNPKGLRRIFGPQPRREPEANRSATSALNRACIRKAKEILARRALRQGECGRHGEKERRLTWGDLVVFPAMVFMPQGRRAGGISEAIRQRPKGVADARREVRAFIVVRKRRESGVTCAIECRAREDPKGISLGAKGGHKEGAKRRLS